MNIKDSLINDYGSWMRRTFPYKLQKISVDAGFTCPNRDGRIGHGGCIFCDNRTFNPTYCNPTKSIRKQVEDGKAFFGRKYPAMHYLVYFQAYTNTYASLPVLQERYEEALDIERVEGIVIGTRPDCVSTELLSYLSQLSRYKTVIVEYGIESVNDSTLRYINRNHTFECVRKAIEQTVGYNLLCGGHVILGLPGEDREEILRQAPVISSLPLDMLKIHQLQIIRNTRLAEMYAAEPFHLFRVGEYVELVADYVQMLRETLVLERFVSQSPADMLLAPKWGIKNHEFTNMLRNYMRANGMYQGRNCII